MANCTYTLKGRKFNSYTELLNFVDDLASKGALELDKLDDIVYSKYPAMDAQVADLKKLKASYNPKIETEFNVSSLLNGEPEVNNSIINFLDSKACAINGRQLVTPLDKAEYVTHQIKKLVGENPTSEEEKAAREAVQATLDHWQRVQEDSFELHKMYTDPSLKNNADFLTKFYDHVPESLKDVRLLTELSEELRKRFNFTKRSYPDSTVISNINLTAKIKQTGQEILGHIDQLIIDKNGTLHLYLYKTTSTAVKDWPNVKLEKYKYQLAFLKRMLAANGVNVENIELNIIPVQVNYNDDYSKVQSIIVLPTETYSTRFTQNAFGMHRYDQDAAYFIEVKPNIKPITDKFVARVDEINKAIFPELNIRQKGISTSAKSWILNAPDFDYDGTEPLVIKEVGDKDHYYDVIINGTTYPIKTKGNKNTNPEIYEIVEKHLTELADNLGYSVQRLKEAIQECYSKKTNVLKYKKGIRERAINITAALHKYITPNYDKDGNAVDYDWELLENLVDSNVLIFRHKKTNSIDVITLSAFDLNAKAKFKKADTILGHYLYKSDYLDLESNYGNIELIRTLTLLNEIIPQLGDIKLGNVGILSAIGQFSFIQHNIGNFSKKYYYKIVDTVNTLQSEVNIQNNFKKAKFVSELEYLTQEYLSLTNSKNAADKSEHEKLGFGELQDLNGKEHYVQVQALRNIMQQIQISYPDLNNIDTYNSIKNESGTNGDIARLYDLVAKAYFALTGDEVIRKTKFDNIETTFVTPNTIDNPNIQFIARELQITYDTIASEFGAIYDNEIQNHFSKFYKAAGYTAAQNMSIGNLASQFNNLYEKETLTFKNPYDMSNNLKTHERELLKVVLFQIAKITTKNNFSLSLYDDAAIAKYIESHPEYLWIPLEKASKATGRTGKDRVFARLKNGLKRLKSINDRFDEYVNGVDTREERKLIGNDDDAFYLLSLKNPFQLSMPIGQSNVSNELRKDRAKLISDYGSDFFETNIENVLIDYLVKSIQTDQLQKFMVVSKAFMLRMHLTGQMGGNKAVVEKEIKHIENYLKVNVYNSSIMSKKERAVMSVVMPLKQFATNVLIGGNIVGFVRDTFQGLEENFIRTFTKLNTDIDTASVAKAYAYVTTHARSNAMAVNLLGKLCSVYRISNTDVGRIGERAKTGRNGILNYDNWLYGTMRSPDFINRMTLFVAKCMHDGVWDAYSIDRNNNLVYDWKKDTRFSIYASGNTSHKDYKRQKSLYFSKIKEYNETHPENPIEYTGDLPTPYSQREIMAIRDVGDNIYGAYDKSKKAMAESHSLGICFGMFTTWLNGIVNNYLMKPQKNGVSKLLEEQEIDENGNLKWYREDGSITVEENTGVPVLKFVPPIVMGVFPSIAILAKMCKNDGLQATWDYINANPVMKANMRKILSDLLMAMLLMALFKLALDPAYKEHKKEAADNPVIQNLVTEILYKGGSRSYDTFKGLYNVIDFIGNNNATPIYSVPSQLLHNAWSFVTDDKDLGTIFTTNTGIGRSFKDTYKIYRSAQAE